MTTFTRSELSSLRLTDVRCDPNPLHRPDREKRWYERCRTLERRVLLPSEYWKQGETGCTTPLRRLDRDYSKNQCSPSKHSPKTRN